MTEAAARLSRVRLRRVPWGPHAVLAIGVGAMLLAEAGYDERTSDAWLLLEAAIAFCALVYAWRAQEQLRLLPLLSLALAFHLALLLLHQGLGIEGDFDSRHVYRDQGNALLDGRYPHSEYPVGAVLLFALEAWVGGGATRDANAFLMVPFQLLTVAAVWSLRTRWSAWLAALVALWPMNTFYWEFKFDLVPAALLAVGLALALRGRWGWCGIALGLAAAVKWTPGLAFLALAAWLATRREWRLAARLTAAFAATVLLVYVPFVAWSPDGVWAAYDRQGGRSITAESIWFLPLQAAGLARVRGHISFVAGAPHWADTTATVIQVLLVVATIGAAALARASLRGGIAIAAMAPVVFLVTNRIFSPQYLVVMLAAWAVAGALVLRTRRELLAFGIVLMAATFANAFVYPFALPHYSVTWRVCSAILFVLSLAATGWISWRALASGARRSSTGAGVC